MKMLRVFFVCYIMLLFALSYWCYDSFRQERAKLRYYNPKYIKDVVVFTGRKSRHDPYLTNMTATILMPYGNNVTTAVTLSPTSGGDFRMAARVCDSLKNKWMAEFMQSYTNLSLTRCPVPPGRYIYKNMQLPPKNVPVPIADGDYLIKFELLITATKETIAEAATFLHYDNTKTKGGKKKG